MAIQTRRVVEEMLFKSMEGECIRLLLAGNDTQCFTTQQYVDARDQWIAKITGSTRAELGLDDPPIEFARTQLRAITLVEEVRPDVWKLRHEDSTP